jgi:hypothetical protein
LFNALGALTDADVTTTVVIRQQPSAESLRRQT